MVDAAEEIIPSACQEVQKADNETKKSMETAGIRFETYLDSLIDDPHLTSVGLIQSVEHPTEGTLRVAGPAATWSKTPPSIRHYPPRLGEHGQEILRESGFSDAEIERLAADGALINPDL